MGSNIKNQILCRSFWIEHKCTLCEPWKIQKTSLGRCTLAANVFLRYESFENSNNMYTGWFVIRREPWRLSIVGSGNYIHKIMNDKMLFKKLRKKLSLLFFEFGILIFFSKESFLTENQKFISMVYLENKEKTTIFGIVFRYMEYSNEYNIYNWMKYFPSFSNYFWIKKIV